MSSKPLDNLVKIGQLKAESPTANELKGLLHAARLKLQDAQIESLSLESRFELAYSAAHSFSLAALRSQGYRSENRFVVFQCLAHTTSLAPAKIRILSDAHNKRNLAAYEGEVDVTEGLVTSVIDATKDLLKICDNLPTQIT